MAAQSIPENLRLNPLPPSSPATPMAAGFVPNLNPPTNLVESDPRTRDIAGWIKRQFESEAVQQALHSSRPLSREPESPQLKALRALAAKSARPDQFESRFRTLQGTPILLKGLDPQSPNTQRKRLSADPDLDAARDFLRENRLLLGIKNPDVELLLDKRETDELGYTQLRFSQFYGGLAVWPCELTLHLNPDSEVSVLNGSYIRTPDNVERTPVWTADQAVQQVRVSVPLGTHGKAEQPELILYGPLDADVRLAWKVELEIGLTQAWRCVVDALDGSILARISMIQNNNVPGAGTDALGLPQNFPVWSHQGSFFLIDTTKPMYQASSSPPQLDTIRGGIIVLDAQNTPPNSQPDPSESVILHSVSASATGGWVPDAVSAYLGLAKTYDYFLDRHGRNSLDDQGGNILAVVRIGIDFLNAFWSPGNRIMGYGDGFSKSIDVNGHELTHGVINSLGNGGVLEYLRQPGALNEAFADIFGEMVEAYANDGSPDWLKGAEIVIGPMQNYANPSAVTIGGTDLPNPSRMSEFYNLPDDIDKGGVHINSSIINHAYYLLAEGLPDAVGIRDAERIFYRALTRFMQKQSQFIDARHACVTSAEQLFGVNSVQARKTIEAFDRVEIFAAPAAPPPSELPTVAAADSTLGIRRDINTGQFFLVRREGAQNDPALGTALNTIDWLQPRRVSVTGDGSLAFYVTRLHDLGFITTDGSAAQLLQMPGVVHSAAVAPNGERFAFVLLDQNGAPTSQISVIDIATEQSRTFDLHVPATGSIVLNTVRYADAMEFLPDGQTLIYDAFSEIVTDFGVRLGSWTMYALDVNTGLIRVLLDVEPGLNFGNPSLGRTRSQLITFEVVDAQTGVSSILAGNLLTGDIAFLGDAGIPGALAFPTYNGDDSAIIYTYYNPNNFTQASLAVQPLAPDGFTPEDEPTWWLHDAGAGLIYRRGEFRSINAPPSVTLNQPQTGAQFELEDTILISATASDSDGTVSRVEYYAGATRLGESTQSPHQFSWSNPPQGEHRVLVRAFDNLGASTDSSVAIIQVGLSSAPILLSSGTLRGSYSPETGAVLDAENRRITLSLPQQHAERFFRLESASALRIISLEVHGEELRFLYE